MILLKEAYYCHHSDEKQDYVETSEFDQMSYVEELQSHKGKNSNKGEGQPELPEQERG